MPDKGAPGYRRPRPELTDLSSGSSFLAARERLALRLPCLAYT